MTIPVCIPVVPQNAQKYVNAVIERNWISSLCLDEEINFIHKLEQEFSSFMDVAHGCAVTSGTTALNLALATLGIGEGDEVIVPSFTMIATAGSIVHQGAKPVFVDSDEESWCIDTAKIEEVITKNTKAIMPVHIYGYPAEMDRILKPAKAYNLYVIEDAAEAIGTEYHGQKAGSFGDMSCFSFYANKTVTCGEGGMLITNNPQWAERAKMLKDQAFGSLRFKHEEIGYNYRMNNLTAAYAYASFEEVAAAIEKRKNNAQLYNQLLKEIPGIVLPPVSEPNKINAHWMYCILVDSKKFGRTKDEVRHLLKSQYGIDTRDLFYPMHKQPIMIKKGYASPQASMPVSERLWQEGMYLPSSTNLKPEQIDFIAQALSKLKR